MKRTMFDYSESKRYIIDKYKDDLNIKGSILVDCQQMIESLLKWGLYKKFGSYENTHSIQRLCKDYDKDLFKSYREFCYELTSLYYEERYDNDYYEEYEDDEYYEVINKSFRFRQDLLDRINNSNTTSVNDMKDFRHF